MQRHRLRKGLINGIALLCLVNTAFGLDPTRRISQYVHDKWGEDKGYIGGRIYAIGQSADGYLWIGTERGLVRFDGSTFTLIQQPLPNSPPLGPVRGLVTDAQGNLWIRLEGPRMLLYRDGKFEDAFAHFDLQDVTCTAMSPDNEGGLLLSGLGDRTIRYWNSRFETVVGLDQNPGTVTALAETRDGKVWLGTSDNGLFRLRDGQVSKVAESLGDSTINALLPANNGGLWIGTDRGLRLWDGSALTTPALPASVTQLQILALVRDHDANVWLGTNHGNVRVDALGGVSLEQLSSESGSEFTAIFEDRDHDLWFGGSQGLERLRNGMFTTYSTSEGLP